MLPLASCLCQPKEGLLDESTRSSRNYYTKNHLPVRRHLFALGSCFWHMSSELGSPASVHPTRTLTCYYTLFSLNQPDLKQMETLNAFYTAANALLFYLPFFCFDAELSWV